MREEGQRKGGKDREEERRTEMRAEGLRGGEKDGEEGRRTEKKGKCILEGVRRKSIFLIAFLCICS